MEQLVLYLVSKGFATCYLGDAKSKPDLDPVSADDWLWHLERRRPRQ